MDKFKIGDAVKVHYHNHPANGMVGRVMEISTIPWIDFGEGAYFSDSAEHHAFWNWDSVPAAKPDVSQCYPISQDSLELAARSVEKETEQVVDEALGLVSVQMRIPVELHEALKAIAEGKGWVLPAVMREALSLYAYQANTA